MRCGHAGQRKIDLRTLAALDRQRRRPAAFEAATDALHHVLARRQVVGVEAALLLAHHHEGEMALPIGELHHGAGYRLPGRIVHDALNGAAVAAGLGCRGQGAERCAGEISPQCCASHGVPSEVKTESKSRWPRPPVCVCCCHGQPGGNVTYFARGLEAPR
jgi:hypothetical protein